MDQSFWDQMGSREIDSELILLLKKCRCDHGLVESQDCSIHYNAGSQFRLLQSKKIHECLSLIASHDSLLF